MKQMKNEFIIVLNLVISGIPSILNRDFDMAKETEFCFKPCYKWNTFNTMKKYVQEKRILVF